MTLHCTPTVGSLFSGIGGFDLGLERAGWQVAWQVESNQCRREILRRHWPKVDVRNDIRTDTDGLGTVDLICGGFPCQDLSVAGRRAGLAGERSGLFFQFARILGTLRPAWCLIENVPGLLSSNDGRDFAVVLATLAELGYWWTYRVLDSQRFGVPQRRRRVYVVGHLGSPCPPEILFEPTSLRRDSASGETAQTEVAGTLGCSASVRGRYDGDTESFVAHPLLGQGNDRQDETRETYIVNARQTPIVGPQPIDTSPHSFAVVSGTVTGAEAHNGNSTPIAANYVIETAHTGRNGLGVRRNSSYTLDQWNTQAVAQPLRANRWGGSDSHGDEGNVVVGSAPDADGVRETTGVPRQLDAQTADGPRYGALGDAVTVNVAEWIGRRMLHAHHQIMGES